MAAGDKVTQIEKTPDGGAIVRFNERLVDIPVSDENVNLVPLIKESGKQFRSYFSERKLLDSNALLAEIGNIVCEEYDDDVSSRAGWEANNSEAVKLFSNFVETKSYPWPNASNVKLPVITTAAIQFQARAYDSLIPSKDVVRVLHTGEEDIERGERVGKYMNYQLLYKMREFKKGMDKTLMQLPIMGSVFRKTYFHFGKERCATNYVSAADLVVSYYTDDFDEAPRKTHQLKLSRNDIRKRVNAGVYIPEAWNLDYGTSTYPVSPIKEAADVIQGLQETSQWYDTPRLILEQHRDWDIDGDGIAESYVITVDYETKLVLRITPRRFKDGRGKVKDIDYFTHYSFIPNPEGVYDVGFGALLRGLNESMNSIVNEVIDAGSLANLQGGFVSKRSGIKKGELKFHMGEYKEVDTYIDDIRKAIYHMDFKGPNSTLYSTLGLLYEYAKLVSSVSETMTGQLPSSDTPATTIMALIEEGRKVYSTIYKRIHSSFHDELTKMYRLNSIFLDEEEYFRVLGDSYAPTDDVMRIGRADFIDTIDIIPISDPNLMSKAEKVLRAQQVHEEVKTNPILSQNEDALRESTRRYLEALEEPKIEELMPPPPEPPNLTPEQENTEMLMERDAQVLPEQDHVHHLDVHSDFVDSPVYGPELSSNAKNLFEVHHKEHIAAMYLNEEGGNSGSV